MELRDTGAFALLAKPVQDAVAEKGFEAPTEPQAKAIPEILEGRNVLLIAPTASGKTEAAILPVLSMLMASGEKAPGIKILYITPLRALNRDLLERLQWWCSKLDVKVAVRHGDTAISERGKQARDPPDMLITTPETLQAILPGRVMRRHLRQVRYVIVDEIHELAEDKRGSQLALALERLRWTAMRDFQVIGLSATIGTPEVVAKFLVGAGRDVRIVKVPVARSMRLEVIFPEPGPADYDLAEHIYTHPEVAARLRVMRELIANHRSVLLFTNTRAVAEVLASRFRVWDVDFPLGVHHGSLSKPSRVSAEEGLKRGDLQGLVCTSSLELGIDVGRIDFIIQYMSPRQVTRLIQRVGRSGHRIGRTADGVIVALDSDDTLEAMAIARRALKEDLEPVAMPSKPLDALTHQIVGLLTQKGRWRFQEILELFRGAYPYSDLGEGDLAAVLAYMHSRFPRLAWVSFEDRVVLRPRRLKDLYEYYFDKLSMIPDEKQYLVTDQSTDTPIGVLDEAFVAEYGEPGTKFIIRGGAWIMASIRGDRIYVKPVADPTGAIPSWVGEEIPVPYEIAQEVGEVRRLASEAYRAGKSREEIVGELAEKYPADPETVMRALKETFEQVELGLEVPTDKLITVEDWDELVIVNAHLGLLVNRTLARLVGHLLSEEIGMSVGVQQDPYRIVVQASGMADGGDVISIIETLAHSDIRPILAEASKKTGLFKRRLVHVARRFGAISRWVDFSSISLRQLMRSFEGTVIFDEALKETFEKDLDVSNTVKVLGEIRRGDVRLVRAETGGKASPIARIGIERISRKTDLIPPDKMRRILVESTRVRILNEVKTFACTKCWKYVGMSRIKDLPEDPRCPECSSTELGVLDDPPEEILRVLAKKGRSLSQPDKRILDEAAESAKLVKGYGKVAACVLAGKRLTPREAARVLRREKRISDRLFELIMEGERAALKKRFL